MILGGIGMPELIIILAVVLIVFGPKNLPKLGETLGKTVKNVREGMAEEDEPKQINNTAEQVTDVEPEPAVQDSAPASEGLADKYCPKCGAKNPGDNAFCAKCGTKLQ